MVSTCTRGEGGVSAQIAKGRGAEVVHVNVVWSRGKDTCTCTWGGGWWEEEEEGESGGEEKGGLYKSSLVPGNFSVCEECSAEQDSEQREGPGGRGLVRNSKWAWSCSEQ